MTPAPAAECFNSASRLEVALERDIEFLEGLPADFRFGFVQPYFACAPIDRLDALLPAFVKNACALLASALRKAFPPRRSYEVNLLKKVIKLCNAKQLDISHLDCIYERLCQLMTASGSEDLVTTAGAPSKAVVDTNDECFYRIYLDVPQRRCVVVGQHDAQLSRGTTGLSCWEASFLMAQFWRSDFFDAKCCFTGGRRLHFVELGAGCGLAGIAAATSQRLPLASVTLTDADEHVLAQLHKNVALNVRPDSDMNVSVLKLDWLNYNLSLLPYVPDVVFASDVVYDVQLLPAFCRLLARLLALSPNAVGVAFVACTVRNAETFDNFLSELRASTLRICRTICWSDCDDFRFLIHGEDGDVDFLADTSEPMYLTAELAKAPVKILEIRLADNCYNN